MRDFVHSISADARLSRAPDPQLERLLRRVVAIGLALVLLFFVALFYAITFVQFGNNP